MDFQNNLHYISENLPRYITDHLPDYVANYLQPRGFIADHSPDHIIDKLQNYMQECRPVFDTIKIQCVPSSTVIAAIFVYLFLALLLSRFNAFQGRRWKARRSLRHRPPLQLPTVFCNRATTDNVAFPERYLSTSAFSPPGAGRNRPLDVQKPVESGSKLSWVKKRSLS